MMCELGECVWLAAICKPLLSLPRYMLLLINNLHKMMFLELHVNLVLAIDVMLNIINGVALVLPPEFVKIIILQDMDFVLAHVHSEVPQHCWVVNELLRNC